MNPNQLSAEQILTKLVAFDTTSSGSNLALIEWVEAYLAPYKVHSERVNETNEHGVKKAALLVRIGPAVEGGIVLSGHTDVVPVKDQQWTGGAGAETAFTLTERDGKLYGRGSADMKGFIALALARVPQWVTLELKRPVWLALSFDEEIGCKCAEPLAVEFTKHAIKPQLIIVGEPTLMDVVDEHKGIDSFETIITGKEAHSSGPQLGVNAAYYMGELLAVLNGMTRVEKAKADAGSPYPTPYSTVHVGVAQSGTARNIIPKDAKIVWEVRPLPGVNVDEVLAPYHAAVEKFNAQIKAHFPECGIVTHRLTHVHGLRKKTNAAYLSLATYLAGSNAPASAVSYATEGGAFGEQGFPTVICGPGSIDQAHGPDEFIARSQLEKGAAMMVRIGEVLVGERWDGQKVVET